MNPEEVKKIIREELEKFIRRDRFTFTKLLQILDGRNIQVGKTTGTIIGTETIQKIGFFAKSPVVQQSAISDADGTLGSATSRVNAVIAALEAFGFIAQ